MLRIEEITNKGTIFEKFFTWLFDDDRILDKSIELDKEIDMSLCSSYQDPYIYYPKQIKAFFETPAMKRLGRISQLDLTINDNQNAFHNRLEHSKGTYSKKLEELFYNYQNPNWKKYIEDNNLKLYLIAELIKMAGHDIGHTPLSHAIERETLGRKGLHEEIGQRIMLENPEIQQTLSKISPELPQILSDLYNNDILNFQEHDESNYDVDRLDYLNRDSLYLGDKIYLPVQHYSTVNVEKDKNGLPKINQDFSISETTTGNSFIDVYDYSALSEIEKTFSLRLSRYSNKYMPQTVTSLEKTIPILLQYISDSESDIGKDLAQYLSHLSNASVQDIDLDEFTSWDEIKFNTSLLNIAEKHPDSNIRDMAAMLIPQMHAFLNLIYSHLDMHNKTKKFSESELELLRKIKQLIKGDGELSKNLRNPNFAMSNIIFIPADTIVLSKTGNLLTQTCYTKISAYNVKEPIYVRDSQGKIYELSHHPDRQCDWDKKEIVLQSAFLIVPQLRLNAFSDDEISFYKSLLPSENNHSIRQKKEVTINMQPLQVNHDIENEFEI